jgi:hypothetical protein
VCTGEFPSPGLQLGVDGTDCDNPCPGHEKETCGKDEGGDGYAKLRFWQNLLESAKIKYVRLSHFVYDQSGQSLAFCDVAACFKGRRAQK